MAPPGEPRESPKPQPIGSLPLVILFTTCTLCALFLLWRRATALRGVVSHQLKTWSQTEGRIRLSEDDGPPAREFIEDDEEEDNGGSGLGGEELPRRVQESGTGQAGQTGDDGGEVRPPH